MRHFSARATQRAGTKGGLCIHLEGYLDGDAAGALTSVLVACIEGWSGHPRVIFCIDKLEYISSLGVGMLIAAYSTARQRGFALSLENAQPPVLHVLELLGVSKYMHMRDSPLKEGAV